LLSGIPRHAPPKGLKDFRLFNSLLNRLTNSVTIESLFELAIWHTFSLFGAVPVSAFAFGITLRLTENDTLSIQAGLITFIILSVILWLFYSHVGSVKQSLPSGLGLLRIATVLYTFVAIAVLLARGMLTLANLKFVLLCFEGIFVLFLLTYTSFALRFRSKIPFYELSAAIVVFAFSATRLDPIR